PRRGPAALGRCLAGRRRPPDSGWRDAAAGTRTAHHGSGRFGYVVAGFRALVGTPGELVGRLRQWKFAGITPDEVAFDGLTGQAVVKPLAPQENVFLQGVENEQQCIRE